MRQNIEFCPFYVQAGIALRIDRNIDADTQILAKVLVQLIDIAQIWKDHSPGTKILEGGSFSIDNNRYGIVQDHFQVAEVRIRKVSKSTRPVGTQPTENTDRRIIIGAGQIYSDLGSFDLQFPGAYLRLGGHSGSINLFGRAQGSVRKIDLVVDVYAHQTNFGRGVQIHQGFQVEQRDLDVVLRGHDTLFVEGDLTENFQTVVGGECSGPNEFFSLRELIAAQAEAVFSIEQLLLVENDLQIGLRNVQRDGILLCLQVGFGGIHNGRGT